MEVTRSLGSIVGRAHGGRLAEPEDIARAVVAVAVDLLMTTGVVIPVDGGQPLGAAKNLST